MSAPPRPSATVKIEVPFHDLDPLRIVWHGNYFKYFEIARTALFRSRGMDGAWWSGRAYHLVVIDSRCRHTHPLRFGDECEVTARFGDLDSRITVTYDLVLPASGVHVARGRTDLVAVGPDGHAIVPAPEELRAKIEY